MINSKQLINSYIQSELELFKSEFDKTMVSENQELRSLAIAWLCYYFNDIITKENAITIINFVDEVHHRETYSHHGWYRISALQAAAFILTSNRFYADKLVGQISCGQSWARGYIIESASIILPLLSFDNVHLKSATELNIKYSQMLYEENVALYLSAKGDSDKKRLWLEQQINFAQYEHKKESLKEFIKPHIYYYQTGFFVQSFNEIKSYFIFKLLSQMKLSKFQPSLFDDVVLNFEELILKEKEHPLNTKYIDLRFLSQD